MLKAKDSLISAEHLKFPEVTSLKSYFEMPTASYLKNIDSEAWQEPRMFTLKQLRDTFFTILH